MKGNGDEGNTSLYFHSTDDYEIESINSRLKS